MSDVAAIAWSSRKGFAVPPSWLPAAVEFGLAVSRLGPEVTGAKPFVGSSGVTRLFACGVPAAAVKGAPPTALVFAAFGYVAK